MCVPALADLIGYMRLSGGVGEVSLELVSSCFSLLNAGISRRVPLKWSRSYMFSVLGLSHFKISKLYMHTISCLFNKILKYICLPDSAVVDAQLLSVV